MKDYLKKNMKYDFPSTKIDLGYGKNDSAFGKITFGDHFQEDLIEVATTGPIFPKVVLPIVWPKRKEKTLNDLEGAIFDLI